MTDAKQRSAGAGAGSHQVLTPMSLGEFRKEQRHVQLGKDLQGTGAKGTGGKGMNSGAKKKGEERKAKWFWNVYLAQFPSDPREKKILR